MIKVIIIALAICIGGVYLIRLIVNFIIFVIACKKAGLKVHYVFMCMADKELIELKEKRRDRLERRR